MLPRSHRLKRPADFQKVYKKSRKSTTAHLRGYFQLTGEKHSRFGFVVPNKSVSTIVRRNRIKRILRDAVQKHSRDILPGFSIIIQAGSGLEKTDESRLRDEVKELLKEGKILK